jgi:hypothetical protein
MPSGLEEIAQAGGQAAGGGEVLLDQAEVTLL